MTANDRALLLPDRAAVHPALLAERVARIHQAQAAKDRTVAITTASAGTAREINVAIQRKRNPGRDGVSVALADGTAVFAGDRVATRRNDRLRTDANHVVRNRQTWDVEEVAAGRLTPPNRPGAGPGAVAGGLRPPSP